MIRRTKYVTEEELTEKVLKASTSKHLKERVRFQQVVEARLGVKLDPSMFYWNERIWNLNLFGITLWMDELKSGGCEIHAQKNGPHGKQRYVSDVSSPLDLAPFYGFAE